jgi:CHAT domain-containing protein
MSQLSLLSRRLRAWPLKSLPIALLVLLYAIIGSQAQAAGESGSARSLLKGHRLEQNGTQKLVLAEKGEIKLGYSAEPEMKGGEVHQYHINLKGGQYLNLVVEQKGIDVLVRVLGPENQKVAEVDGPNGTQGPERVAIIAEVAGMYRLEVQSPDKQAGLGRYEIKVNEIREATTRDWNQVTAGQLSAEADKVRTQGTAVSLRKAIEKYQEALTLWRLAEDRQQEANALSSIGFLSWQLGENKQSLDYNTQALALWRELKDIREEARTLHSIGLNHSQLGDLRKALEYYSQALPLRGTAKDRQGEAFTLNATGLAYENMGKLREALDYYNQSLTLLRAIGNPREEATLLTNIGGIYFAMGDLPEALGYFNQALQMRRTTGDRRGEAVTLNNLGVLYWQLGENQKALEYHNQALPLRRLTGDRNGEAATLQNIGIVYLSLSEPQKALEFHNQALSLARTLGDRRSEATTLQNIGTVNRWLNNYPKALDYLNQALTLRRANSDLRGEANTLSRIGVIHSLLGEPAKAISYLEHALSLHRSVGDHANEALTLQSLARAQRDRGRLREAQVQIEAALTIIESTRAKFINQQLRTSFLASRHSFYEFYIDLLMQINREQPANGYDAEALQVSERARARSLLEMLTEAHTGIRHGVDPVLLERERTLHQQLSTKAERLTRLLSGKPTEEQVAVARKELDALLEEFQDVEAQIRTKSPRYAALTQPQPLSLKEIQQQVLDKDTLLLEYSLGEERSYLWVASETTVRAHELPKRTEIESLARRVYELLTARNRQIRFETAEKRRMRIAKADAEYWQAAKALSEVLFQATKAQMKNKRLLIVADGILQYIPFAALPSLEEPRPSTSSKPRPLIANHEIVSLPSASTLGVLRREFGSRPPVSKMIAVLADPVFDKDDERVIGSKAKPGSAEEGKDAEAKMIESELTRSTRDFGLYDGELYFPRLPSTRREADAIVAVVPSAYSRKAVDFSASEATAKDAALGQFRYVHFATHGLINSAHPELSGIVLSLVDQQGLGQDGFLVTHEIYNLNLPVEMVVLSGCKTGLGKEIKGEGLIGLTRGFMYAGASRVLVSLWDINDESTADLMARLYKNLLGKQRLSPAAALRAAQLSLWKSKPWQPPYYWAAFLLQGEYK